MTTSIKNISFIFLLVNSLLAQSFIGKMDKNIIWFEMNIDTVNDSVTGNYFYANIKNEIQFSGTINGKQIELTEQNQQQEVAGLFSLTDFGDSVHGTWQEPNTKMKSEILLFKTDPSNKMKMYNLEWHTFTPGYMKYLFKQ